MMNTFRAMQIMAPGVLEPVEKPLLPPGADEVLIKIIACGVCGADLRDTERGIAQGQSGHIPGHEIVGYIAEKGSSVPDIWSCGQRVGVGRLGGYCQSCQACRRGLFHLCTHQLMLGLNCDGGYAEYVMIRHTALIAIPTALSAFHAAPILCAGTATFNALRRSGAKAGDKVAILGFGGLVHMATQYARKMGLEVTVIGRGTAKQSAALAFGAHHYIDALQDDVLACLKSQGGVNVMLVTAPDAEAVSAWLPGLTPQGTVVMLGSGPTPLQIPPGVMIGGERTLTGSFVSAPIQTEDALRFSHLFQALPAIEVMPLEQANAALAKLKRGQARYRIVLTMAQGD